MIYKILSGRLILTIACAIVFIYASINKILEAQAVAAIIATVFQAYFMRGDRNQNNKQGDGTNA